MEGYFGGAHASLSWQTSDKSTAALQANCAAAGQLPPFLTLNWNQQQQVDQGGGSTTGIAHFQSPLTPSGAAAPAPHLLPHAASMANDSAAIRELIGRLNSGEISQWTTSFAANATACFNTPPQSFPPTHLPHNPTLTGASPQLSSLAVDPAFVERAARFSSFCGGLPGQFPLPDVLKLSTAVPISPTLRPGGGGSQLGAAENNEISVLSRSSSPDDGEFMRGARDDSPSASEQKFPQSNSKKRKADASPVAPPASRVPLKAVAEDDVCAKRMKPTDAVCNGKDEPGPKVEGDGGANSSGDMGCRKHGKESNSKAAEPPKDYIHVRARRGQATDSHSLAERVRREKISQRMKFLQDLVPGCNKVTGKAVMLDEIINYVQSLQRQVEFLSMKLATVNPQMDFNGSTILQKDMYQPRGSLPNAVFQMESSSLPFPFAQPPPPQDVHLQQNVVTSGIDSHLMNPMDSTLKRPLNSVQLPALDGFGGSPHSRVGSFMEDDLHSVVQMGLGQTQEDSFSSQPFHQGSTPDMKIKF